LGVFSPNSRRINSEHSRSHQRRRSSSICTGRFISKSNSKAPSEGSVVMEFFIHPESIVIEDVSAPVLCFIEPESFELVGCQDAGVQEAKSERPYIARIHRNEEKEDTVLKKGIRRSESEMLSPLHDISLPSSCRSCDGRLQEYSLEEASKRESQRLQFPVFIVVEADQAATKEVIHRLSVADADSERQMFVVIDREALITGDQDTVQAGGAEERSPSVQSGKSELIADIDEDDVELSYGSALSRLTELTHITYQSRQSRMSSIDWDTVQYRSTGNSESAAAKEVVKKFSKTIVGAIRNSKLQRPQNRHRHGNALKDVENKRAGRRNHRRSGSAQVRI